MRYLLIYIAVIGACLFGFSQNRFYSECGFLRGGIYILADGEDTFPRLKDTILFEAQLPIYEWNERDSFTKMIKPVVDDFVASIFRRGKKWNSSFFIQTPPAAKDTAGNILDSIRIAGFYVYTEFTNLSVMSDDRYGRELPNGVLVYDNPDSAGKSPILCYIYDNDKSFPKSYEFVTTGDTLKYQLIGPPLNPKHVYPFSEDLIDNRFWGIVTDDSVIVLEYIYEDHPYTYLYDVRQTVLDDSFKEKFSTLGIKAVGYTPPRAKR
jgi:hypothetical protein